MAEENNKSAENAEENVSPENTAENSKAEASAEATDTPESTDVKEVAEEAAAEVQAAVEEKVEETKEAVEEVAAEAEATVEAVAEAASDEEGGEEADAPREPRPVLYPNVDPGEFNWADVEEDKDAYSAEERNRLSGIYEDTLTSIEEKKVTTGTVVAVNKKEVVVNIGYKSEGVLAASEFRYNPDLKAGDEVPVFVQQQEDASGQLVISHKTARIHDAWIRVNNSLTDDEIITGFVKCRTKGGLIVDVFGIEAFLPGSQIDVKPIRDYDMYVGKQMEFKVVKINKEYKNVVVSHKALIEAELEEQKKQIIGSLEKGQVLEGTVKNITSYGVFMDLGGVDGLVHITDLSWGRINHPEEVVELDQKLNVVILDFDDDKKRIALGLKQLQAHPWDALDEKLNVGDRVKGRVVVLADYGAFVEIAPGVEGLIHVSEMSWSQHLRSAQDFLKVNDEVEAEILTLDREDRKMSLGMKQLMTDPWGNIEEKYAPQTKHTAKIRNFTNFGVFVELEEGIDGLIHISDLSWSKKVKHPSEFCNIGDDIEVVVLELNKEKRRLGLGHKQLEENPWDVFETIFQEGSVHQGTVVRKEGQQFVMSLPYGVEGYITSKHLKKEDGSTADLEETLDVMVIEFNKSAKRIVVSHRRTYEEAPERPERTSTPRKSSGGGSGRGVKNVQQNIEKTTLGDLGVLEALKSKMEGGAPAEVAEVAEVAEEKEEKKTKAKAKKTAKAKKAEAVEDVAEAAAEEVAEVADAAEAATEEVTEVAEEAKDAAEEVAEEATEAAEETVADAADEAEEAADEAAGDEPDEEKA